MDNEELARASAKKTLKIWLPTYIVIWVLGAIVDGISHVDSIDARRTFTAAQYAVVYCFLLCLFVYISYARTYFKLANNNKLLDWRQIAKLKAMKALNISLIISSVLWFGNLLILNPFHQGSFIGHESWTFLLKRGSLFVLLSLLIAIVSYRRAK